MFVHSLWSETPLRAPSLAEVASGLLGVPITRSSPRSAELLVVGADEEIAGADEQWQQTVRTDGPLGMWLYETKLATGVASANPSLNFWLWARVSDKWPVLPLRLVWNREWAYESSGWQLSAVHLQHALLSTEAVIQGPWGDPNVVVGEAAKLPDYDVAGVSLADVEGRTMTLYDGGQLWLQQVGPNEVPDLIDDVVSPLFARS